jgi:nucleoside-diphosphate-sugar epimerase
MAKSIAADIGIELIWGMITNAYGVGEVSPRMVNTTIRKCINGESPQFTAGTQNYDFVYVEDVAKAFYLIAEKGRPFCQYMIGSGRAGMLREFIVAIRDATSPDTPLKFGDIPFTGVNMSMQVFSTYDIEKDCGYRPEVSFEEGVKRTMDWLKTMEESDI